MTTSTSLIDLILSLLRDPKANAAFQEDPSGWLASCGAGDVTPEDIHEALILVNDSQDADFSRDYHTGGQHVQIPPPPAPAHGESQHEAAVKYLNNYVTNNYVTNNETIIDKSINQQIDTDGGDFDQDIEDNSVTAVGDGAVAVGDDIENSNVVTGNENTIGDGNVKGDGNVVGDDNEAVTGDHNVSGFGSGDVTSVNTGAVSVGDGGSFNTGGTTTIDNSDTNLNNVGNTNIDASTNDSGNTTVDASITDSFNDDSDNSSHVDASLNDSSDNSTHVDSTIDESFNS